MQLKKFLFTTGTTGGHIFPILSLAVALQKIGHQVDIVHTGSTMEKKILSKYSFTLHKLKIGRLNKGISFFERFKTLITLPFVILRSITILIKVKPHTVMGCGGAISGPVILSAYLLRKQTAIWELNARFGLANQYLSRIANLIFIHFEELISSVSKKKYIVLPFISRAEMVCIGSQKRKPDGYSHLLILGGSQGASRINQVVTDMYHQESFDTWKIIHQTGSKDFASIQSVYSKDQHAQCFAFLDRIAHCYQWADVVIARAGASTLSELATCKKASILIPLPSASDGHQLANAKALFKKQAIELILEKDLNSYQLFEKIMSIYGQKKRELENNIHKWYQPDGLQKMIDLLSS